MHEDELADVVQQRGDHQPVAGLVAKLAGEPVGGALGGDGVKAEALGDPLPDGRALEEVKRARAAGDRMNGPWREHLDGLDGALDATAAASVDLVGKPQDRHGTAPRRLRRRRRRRPSTARRPRTGASRGCGTRPGPGTPPAPRRRPSGDGRGLRCDGVRAGRRDRLVEVFTAARCATGGSSLYRKSNWTGGGR